MSNIENDGPGGDATWASILAIVLVFGGIAAYFIKSKDENQAFFRFFGVVALLMVAASLSNCFSA